MTYELHPEAEFEFLEAAARYETEVPGLGERFGDEVERAIDLLVEHPGPRIPAAGASAESLDPV